MKLSISRRYNKESLGEIKNLTFYTKNYTYFVVYTSSRNPKNDGWLFKDRSNASNIEITAVNTETNERWFFERGIKNVGIFDSYSQNYRISYINHHEIYEILNDYQQRNPTKFTVKFEEPNIEISNIRETPGIDIMLIFILKFEKDV